MSNAELPRLLAVFLVIFDDLQGGKVAFQVPEGSVGGGAGSSGTGTGTGTGTAAGHQAASSSTRSSSRHNSGSKGRDTAAVVASEEQKDGHTSDSSPPPPAPATTAGAGAGGGAGDGGATLGDSGTSSSLPPGSSLLAATAHANRFPASSSGAGSGLGYGTAAAAAAAAATAAANTEPLFNLTDILQYILPRRPVVRHLVTICVDNCKILGFPVWIENQKYPRGHFIYNVCFAFPRNAELNPYEPVVRKTGRVLRHMEETTFLLSNPDHEIRLHSILEQIFEDLGSYSETSIPLDEANTLDLKLFPQNPNPAIVRDWDIPVPLISLEDLKDESWDITLYNLAGFIDGTRSVKRIANMADVDLPLARECIQHLLYYGCIILHDLFQFTNSYALISGQSSLAAVAQQYSQGVQAECESYVCIGNKITPFATLFKYYARLRPALTLEDWIDRNGIDTNVIDVRRMVSFGIIKGFLRRIQVFPIWLDHPSFRAAEQARGTKHVRNPRGRDKNVRPITTASSWKDADAGNWGGREELLGSHLPPEKDLSLHAPASRKERDTTPRPGAVTSALATQSHHRSDHAHDRERMDGRGYPSGLPGLLDGEHSTDELLVWLGKVGGVTEHLSGLRSGRPYNAAPASYVNGDAGRDSGLADLGRVQFIYV